MFRDGYNIGETWLLILQKERLTNDVRYQDRREMTLG